MSSFFTNSVCPIFESLLNNIKNCDKFANVIIIMFFLYVIFFSHDSILIYKKYIQYCKKGNYFKNIQSKRNDQNYISICIPVYNMEKYIKNSLLSILNQSFQNYEIIFVNDNSNDKTMETIKKYQSINDRIKVINHQRQLGVYCSRKDAILNANGEFILMMDPDDMFLNRDLFKELYNYNSKYNLDITEFLVFHQEEDSNDIYLPDKPLFNHWHEFDKTIIQQPELSDIIFYLPKTKNITSIICRIIWNKIIKKEIMIKAVNYVEKIYKSNFLITADDTPINVMLFNFAKNYSNIKIPGYLYIKKKVSMSRGQNVKALDEIRGYNFYLYFQFLLTFVKEYKKDINFFFKDFDDFHHDLYKIKKLNISYYIPKTIIFLNNLLQIDKIPNNSKLIVEKLLFYFNNDEINKSINA